MEKIKMKWLATGECLVMWKSQDHPDARPGQTIWTDNVYGANWGDAVKWPVPYGFIRLDDPDIELFSPVLSEYWKLKRFLDNFHNARVFETRIDFSALKLPGIPGAVMKNYKTLAGEDRLVVTFDQRIILPTGEKSSTFIIFSGQAIILNTEGGDSKWIPYF